MNKDMRYFYEIERMIFTFTYDNVSINANILTPRRRGASLKDEVVLIGDMPYKVTTDKDCNIVFISAITEAEQIDAKTKLSLSIKFDLTKEDVIHAEVPKLLNINDVKGLNFREFINKYNVTGF